MPVVCVWGQAEKTLCSPPPCPVWATLLLPLKNQYLFVYLLFVITVVDVGRNSVSLIIILFINLDWNTCQIEPNTLASISDLLETLSTRGLVLHAEPRRWEGQSHSLGGRRRLRQRIERQQPIRGLPRTTNRNLRIKHTSKIHKDLVP